jgi:hypothetical protein
METLSEQKEPEFSTKQKPAEQKETYWCIKLAAMRDQFDVPQPIVTVGNRATKHPRIQFKRMMWIPVTGSHIEVLKSTKHTIHLHVVEDGKKKIEVHERVRFPIDDSIQITEEGYKALRAKALSFTNADQKLTEADINPYRV